MYFDLSIKYKKKRKMRIAILIVNLVSLGGWVFFANNVWEVPDEPVFPRPRPPRRPPPNPTPPPTLEQQQQQRATQEEIMDVARRLKELQDLGLIKLY